MIITEAGYGKRSPLAEYPRQGRAVGGVRTIDQATLGKVGKIAAGRVVQAADDLTIISRAGLVLRTRVSEIKRSGRATRGDPIIELGPWDKVASLARISAEDLRSVGATQE